MTKYRYSEGLPFVKEMGGGLNMPQVFAYDTKTDKVSFTDDLIFAPGKSGLFQLLIMPDSQQELESMENDLKDISQICSEFLDPKEATILVQSTDPSITTVNERYVSTIARLAKGEEFAADPALMKNRPYPTGYDEWRLKREIRGKKFVILRQDRFVFAACDTVADLKKAVDKFEGAVHMKASL